MNIERFRDLLDRRGEDLSTWPITDRTAALALLLGDERARAIVEEAKRLRSALTALAEPAPSGRAPAGLADRIAARAADLPQRRVG